MPRTVTARVVLTIQVEISDDATDFNGQPLSDHDAVSAAVESMLLDDHLDLADEDDASKGTISWLEPSISDVTF